MRRLALCLVVLLVAGNAAAQDKREQGRLRSQGQMSQEERQRLREDMREVYRERTRGRMGRPEGPREMSLEEREKLRRDIQDANRELRR